MSTRSREWLLALLVMAIAGALWILPLTLRPQHVPFWTGAGFSDLLISHWPNAVWIQQSIAEWGQIPPGTFQIGWRWPFLVRSLSIPSSGYISPGRVWGPGRSPERRG
jgi:hypothetical protein